jgi:hypothetical protein
MTPILLFLIILAVEHYFTPRIEYVHQSDVFVFYFFFGGIRKRIIIKNPLA